MHNCLQRPKGHKRKPCPLDGLFPRIADKWTILVIAMLSEKEGNRLRYSEIKAGIEGVSQKMLAATLRSLERDGLLDRYVFPEVPPRVEYQLTKRGQELLPSMTAFMDWMQTNWPDIQNARREFDARPRKG